LLYVRDQILRRSENDAMCQKRSRSAQHRLPTQADKIGAWDAHRRSGLYFRFLGALMPQSMRKKKMRMLHCSDHDVRVTAQI
jgi:hypothetical protein